MTSTYSSSLRLELMATGDQSGTWGDTTNTNLGTLLEQAITGYLSVAQGDVANLTLTTTNGASDQARNAIVNVTGALTANRNVVVQTANKLYLIKNSTTGGFVITAKTAAGTGVEIAPNTARWVYSDGTNVVDGLPGLGYGYATTATAAGTTTLTVGSAAQQFFTGATTQTVTMPVTSTLVLGQSWRIVNNSTGVVTVNSSGANAIVAMQAGTEAILTCILTSGTSAASWSITYVPITSNVNSTGLVVPGGSVTATGFIPSSSTVPTNGMYLPAANTLGWAVNSAAEMQLTATGLSPAANDGNALGVSGTAWADLFLADGGVINWNGGNSTITHSNGKLTTNNIQWQVGVGSGGTYNGSITIAASDQFPTLRFNTGATVAAQFVSDVSAGSVFLDAPGGFGVRDTINGGNTVLSTTANQRVVITGSLNRGAPVTKTGDFTVAAGENWIINNRAATNTATLPAAASYTGREIMMSTIQAQAVVSASSNVVPRAGGAAGTAILPATDGAWATLVSDGTNWIIMQSSG